jgi:S-adenosyl methyltransferase
VEEVFGPPAPGHLPAPREMALRDRLFQDRAISWAAREGDGRRGVRQLLVLGAGYPVGGRVIPLPDGGTVTLRDPHEAAADGGREVRCVYLDKDPVAVSRASALAADGAGTVAVEGDLADPAAVLADPVVRGCIDLRQPVCILLGAVLHLYPADAARGITTAWLSAVAAGSVLAVSVPRVDDEGLWRRVLEVYAGRAWNHTRQEVEAFFTGTEVMPPGVVPARGWQVGWQDFAVPGSVTYVLCGLGIRR